MSENSRDDYGYLSVSTPDKAVLKNLTAMGDKLKQLKVAMAAAEAVAEQAKKEYEHFANVVLPQEMFACGVDKLSLVSGGQLELKHNFYCQPNKNAADRKVIVDWLRSHGGGHLVEHDATVAAEDFDRLEAAGVPFVETTTVNTARLKAFLKDGIGATTGVQQFAIDDIPKCVHFQEVVTVDLSLPKN